MVLVAGENVNSNRVLCQRSLPLGLFVFGVLLPSQDLCTWSQGGSHSHRLTRHPPGRPTEKGTPLSRTKSTDPTLSSVPHLVPSGRAAVTG